MDVQDLLTFAIDWQKMANQPQWFAFVNEEKCFLKMNNFPEEPLYTVSWRDQSLEIDETPVSWKIPRH